MTRVAWGMLVALAACKGREPTPAHAPPPPPPPRPAVHRDPHSQARPDEVVVRHLALDLRVDFAAKQLAGTAKLDVARVAPGARELVLDTDGLAIDAVRDCASGAALVHALGPADKIRGRALTITLASDCVEIAYRTGPDAHALLWLDAASTTDKRHPMLFTQSQSIYARTWIPLQDSPGVRFTYDATIHVPAGQWALMSATNPQAATRDGTYRFTMELPIPSYLMALAVGDFAFKSIGARTGVYAEPSVVGAAAYEFAEVDAMIAAAEKLYGPYRWGRYDMLVLPASFPFGGMENPRLTFLTPTVINGDRALVSLIAHELAHSWSGNLVTNATWNDVWLNEGITTYVERRIMEELRGKTVVDLDWAVASHDLARDLDAAGRTNPDTRLALDLGPDRDPESVPGMVAYEKGAELMRAMELAFGREAFDAFLRARFDRLAFHSSDSKAFVADAEPLFTAQRVGWTLGDWLDEPGLPASAPAIESSRYRALERAAADLASTGALPDAAAWTTTDWTTFLDALPESIAPASLQALDAKYHLTASTNVPQLTSWLPRAIHADLRATAPAVRAFLLRVGRRWMTLAVFQAALAKNDYWRALAAKTFDEAKATYHPITRASVAELLAAPTKPTP